MHNVIPPQFKYGFVLNKHFRRHHFIILISECIRVLACLGFATNADLQDIY